MSCLIDVKRSCSPSPWQHLGEKSKLTSSSSVMEASDTVPAVESQPMTNFGNSTTNARDSGDQQSDPQPSPPKRSKGKSKNKKSAETSVQGDQQPGPQPKPPKRSKGKSKNKRSAETAVIDAQHSTPKALGRSGKSQPPSSHLASNRSSPHDVSQPDIVLVVHANGVAGGGSSCPASVNKAKRSGLQLHRTWPAASSKKRWNADGECVLGLPLPPRMKKWLTRDHSIEGKEIRNILILGASFQLMFTAYFAIQNLQSSLHEEEALGASALGCMYGISIVSSLLAPTLIGLIGAKGCLVVAWICYMLYTLSQFHPTWGTLVPASVLLGVFVGPLWTAQGLYVSACGFSFSKRSPHSPYVILSRFNGLFFTLYETTQIVGNLVSSLVLQDGVSNKSEAIVFKFCGPDDCPGTENVTDIEEPDVWVLNTLLAIYMGLQVIGVVLTVFMVTPLPKSEWVAKVSIRDTATSWLTTLIGTEMLFLVPFMIFQSLQQGLLLSEYTKAYISCPIGIHMVGFVMATYGAVTATFVFIFSRLARLTGRLPLFLLAAAINLVVLIVLFSWTPDSSMETIIFLIPLLWGVAEGIWQTQTSSMIAVVFANRKEPAFAIYQACRAVGYTLTFSYHGHLCVSTKIATAFAFLVLGILLYLGVEVRFRFRQTIRGHHSHQGPKETEISCLPGRDGNAGKDKSDGSAAREGNFSGGQQKGQMEAGSLSIIQRQESDSRKQPARQDGADSSSQSVQAVFANGDAYRLGEERRALPRSNSARLEGESDRHHSAVARHKPSVSRYARSMSLERPTTKAGKEGEGSKVTSRCHSVQEIYVLEEMEMKVAWEADSYRSHKERKMKDEVYVY